MAKYLFQRGNKINLGRKCSEETKKKMSKAHKGKRHQWHTSTEFKKGHKHPKEVKKKIKEKRKYQIYTEETRKKIGKAHKGEKSYWWKGGITPLVLQIRHCFEYRQWVSDVFTRDNFTCQICGIRGGRLEAHHIKEFSKIMSENHIKTFDDALNCDELWNINNGITYCIECHHTNN